MPRHSRTTIRRNQANLKKVVGAVKNVKDTAIDKVSDVMSYPARRASQKAILAGEKLLKERKEARSAKELQQKALEATFKPGRVSNGVGVGP